MANSKELTEQVMEVDGNRLRQQYEKRNFLRRTLQWQESL